MERLDLEGQNPAKTGGRREREPGAGGIMHIRLGL
jgi:hypothetical protein